MRRPKKAPLAAALRALFSSSSVLYCSPSRSTQVATRSEPSAESPSTTLHRKPQQARSSTTRTRGAPLQVERRDGVVGHHQAAAAHYMVPQQRSIF